MHKLHNYYIQISLFTTILIQKVSTTNGGINIIVKRIHAIDIILQRIHAIDIILQCIHVQVLV